MNTVKQFACIEYGVCPPYMLMDEISFSSVHQILQFIIYLINGAMFWATVMSHPLFCFVLRCIPVIHYIDSFVLLSDGADEDFFLFVTFLPRGVIVMYIFMWK